MERKKKGLGNFFYSKQYQKLRPKLHPWHEASGMLPAIGSNAKHISARKIPKGGHPPFTRFLTPSELRWGKRLFELMRKHKTPFNKMMTVRYEWVYLDNRKYKNKLNELRKFIKGSGHPFYAIHMYERNRLEINKNAQLHMHVVFHCPHELKSSLDSNFHNLPEVDVREIDNFGYGYVFKQHKSYSPQFAKKFKIREIDPLWKRETGDFVKGYRFNISTDLNELHPKPDWVRSDRCGVRPTRRYSKIITRIQRDNPTMGPITKDTFKALGLVSFILAEMAIDAEERAKKENPSTKTPAKAN